MSPDQRDASMDELQQLDRLIANLREDVDPDDPERDWQDVVISDLADAECKREELLQTFPEVRFWPKEEPCHA